MSQVVVITGCSSGVGLYLAIILAESKKYKVYATMRDVSKNKELVEEAKKRNVADKITVVELDVASDTSAKTCFEQIFKTEGRIDCLVNNAGFSIPGTVEQITMEDCTRQMDTNLFGVIRCCKEVLPIMRKQKSGTVIGVSSVGGVAAVPFNDIYCASKFALEGLFESMAPVYKNFGINICLVEPGAIVTKFVDTAIKNMNVELGKDSELEVLKQKYLTKTFKMFQDNNTAQTGEEVAQHIKFAMEDPNPKLRYQTNKNYTPYVAKLSDPTGVIDRETVWKRYFAD